MFEKLGEGPHYRDPEDDVVFGDIFEAEFLRDIFVREDTTVMGGGLLPGHLARKVGSWMNAELGHEDIDLFSPAFQPKQETRFALAHASFLPDAQAHQAILVSDSCVTATALAQGREGRRVAGRLLFAPLMSVSEEVWQGLVETEDFERFPLPDDERLSAGSVAEFGNCFMVDARDINEHVNRRVASLSQSLAVELEMHWGAYSTRRGPRAYERNTLKLAWLFSGGGRPTAEAEKAADAIARALDLAFQLEGSDLEDVSAAEESVRLAGGNASELTPSLTKRLVDRLHELAQLANTAAEGLAPYGKP
ncbi:MAG TPA: hypothetical protein VIJ66_01735 [Solirubrobacteraceae bacterium]